MVRLQWPVDKNISASYKGTATVATPMKRAVGIPKRLPEKKRRLIRTNACSDNVDSAVVPNGGHSVGSENCVAAVIASDSAFCPGAVVRLCGLQGAAHLNGKVGNCENWDAETGRWSVCLHEDGSKKNVKLENLEALGSDIFEEQQKVAIKDSCLKAAEPSQLMKKSSSQLNFRRVSRKLSACSSLGNSSAKSSCVSSSSSDSEEDESNTNKAENMDGEVFIDLDESKDSDEEDKNEEDNEISEDEELEDEEDAGSGKENEDHNVEVDGDEAEDSDDSNGSSEKDEQEVKGGDKNNEGGGGKLEKGKDSKDDKCNESDDDSNEAGSDASSSSTSSESDAEPPGISDATSLFDLVSNLGSIASETPVPLPTRDDGILTELQLQLTADLRKVPAGTMRSMRFDQLVHLTWKKAREEQLPSDKVEAVLARVSQIFGFTPAPKQSLSQTQPEKKGSDAVPLHRELGTPKRSSLKHVDEDDEVLPRKVFFYRDPLRLQKVSDIKSYRDDFSLWYQNAGQEIVCSWCENTFPQVGGRMLGAEEGRSQFAQNDFLCHECFAEHGEDCEG